MIGNRYIKKVVGGDNPKKGRAKGETTHLKTPVSKWRLVGLDMCPTLRNLVSRLVSGSLFMIRFKGFKSSKTIVLIWSEKQTFIRNDWGTDLETKLTKIIRHMSKPTFSLPWPTNLRSITSIFKHVRPPHERDGFPSVTLVWIDWGYNPVIYWPQNSWRCSQYEVLDLKVDNAKLDMSGSLVDKHNLVQFHAVRVLSQEVLLFANRSLDESVLQKCTNTIDESFNPTYQRARARKIIGPCELRVLEEGTMEELKALGRNPAQYKMPRFVNASHLLKLLNERTLVSFQST